MRSHPFDLTGRKAIVTGGMRGLGLGMVKGLLNAGAEAVIIDILDSGADVAEELSRDGAKIHFVKGDLLDRKDLARAFYRAVELLGEQLHVLINNAGTLARYAAIDMAMEDWDKVMQLNLSSVFQLSQLAAHVMMRQRYGKIINVGSMLSYIGGLNNAAYGASKGGIRTLTMCLSNEWSGLGICVNAVAPGYMETDLNTDFPDERRVSIDARIPIGRWGVPADLAGTAVFLSSPASDYITGVTIPVDGGFIAR
jgi:2-deoxy-D-gluconate 3-dehydrogenase